MNHKSSFNDDKSSLNMIPKQFSYPQQLC